MLSIDEVEGDDPDDHLCVWIHYTVVQTLNKATHPRYDTQQDIVSQIDIRCMQHYDMFL